MRKVRKLLSVICCIACLFAIGVTAHAEEIAVPSYTPDAIGTTVYGNNNEVRNPYARGGGLISSVELELKKAGSTTIQVYSSTVGYVSMQSIGFRYVTIQRYENGGWYDYWRLGDVYLYNTDRHSVLRSVSVAAGYQYRAVVDHYAEKSGWWIFADSETIHNDTGALRM